MLKIHEMFASLQGEGPHTGRPAFFIRLSGCVAPLCPWCDTPQAWKGGTLLSVDHLFDRVVAEKHDFVVITGGEPFAQWDKGLFELDRRLFEAGIAVQYETSGKVAIPKTVKGDVVCSPKFLDGAWQLADESFLTAHHFKFVACEESLDEIDAFVARCKLDLDRVWLMPQGMTRESQLRRMARVWEHCVKKGYRLACRLHVLTFDTKKGV